MPTHLASEPPDAAAPTGPAEPSAGGPVAADEAPVPTAVPLPRVETALTAEQVLERLGTASRRGRLAGYERGGRGGLFSVAAFGSPFDKVMVGTASPAPGGGTVLEFRLVQPLLWPAVFLATLAVTVWPGVWLTDSLLVTWFPSWYPPFGVPTWAWYLPLTVLPLPWVIRSTFRRSNAAAHDSAHRAVRKIAAEVAGRIIPE